MKQSGIDKIRVLNCEKENLIKLYMDHKPIRKKNNRLLYAHVETQRQEQAHEKNKSTNNHEVWSLCTTLGNGTSQNQLHRAICHAIYPIKHVHLHKPRKLMTNTYTQYTIEEQIPHSVETLRPRL